MANIIVKPDLYESLEVMLVSCRKMADILWHLFNLLRNLCRSSLLKDELEEVAQIYDQIIDKTENIATDFESTVV
jgi:hypothetical protein